MKILPTRTPSLGGKAQQLSPRMQIESSGTCMLCEEAPGYRPYPCSHNLCEQCLQRCQAERMYRCPFCRTTQQVAAPSLEYKLLKLITGCSDVRKRDTLMDAARSVARTEADAATRLQQAVDAAIPCMVDYHAVHYEAEESLKIITMLLNGQLTVEQVQSMMRNDSAGDAAQTAVSCRADMHTHAERDV